MKKYLLFFILSFFATNNSIALTLPVSKMQQTLSGVIQQKAFKRGFTNADPRLYNTLDLVSGTAGSAAGTVAATVVLGAVSAPAWATVAIAVAVGTVVGVGVNLAVGGITNWLFSPDPLDPTPITETKPKSDIKPAGGLIAGGKYWKVGSYMSDDPMSPIQATFADQYLASYKNFTAYRFYFGDCVNESATALNCIIVRMTIADGTEVNFGNIRATQFTNAPRSCPPGQISNATMCIVPPTVPDFSPSSQKVTAQKAINDLTPEELQKPLNPKIIAELADKLWYLAASKAGYSGLPYDLADPITQTEVETYQATHTDTYPKVQDFVSPQQSVDAPWSLPADPTLPTQTQTQTQTGTGVGTNPAAANPLENLGVDPGIGAPSLEETPTALQILQPLLNLFPDFKSFVVPSHQATCPKPSFNVFGKIVVMDAQCTIAENQRSSLFAVMAAVWLLCAAIIILRA